MTFFRKSSGSNVTPSTVKRRSGSGWTNVQTIKRRASGAWVTVWSALDITKSSDIDQNDYVSEPAPSQRSMSGGIAVTVTGSAAYTLSWVRISGDTGITINSTTGANVTFSATVLKNTTKSAVWRCTVTDTASGMTDYVDVNVSFQYWTDI